jgi:hypothetical protein
MRTILLHCIQLSSDIVKLKEVFLPHYQDKSAPHFLSNKHEMQSKHNWFKYSLKEAIINSLKSSDQYSLKSSDQMFTALSQKRSWSCGQYCYTVYNCCPTLWNWKKFFCPIHFIMFLGFYSKFSQSGLLLSNKREMQSKHNWFKYSLKETIINSLN